MVERPILAFCHIPKTAGTSANMMLRRYFGSKLMSARFRPNSRQTYRYEDLLADSQCFKSLQCITGHCLKPFVDFREFDSRLKWFTFLRDPVKRFISHYIHQQTGDFGRHKMNLNAWAEKFDRGNAQVQWIAGEEDLEAAKQIIDEKFAFVGNIEQFDVSVQAFAQTMGLNGFSTHVPARQMTIRDTSIREDIYNNMDRYRDTIEENTRLDHELLEHAKKREWTPSKMSTPTNARDCTPGLVQQTCFKIRLAQFQLKDKLIYSPFVKRNQNPSDN